MQLLSKRENAILLSYVKCVIGKMLSIFLFIKLFINTMKQFINLVCHKRNKWKAAQLDIIPFQYKKFIKQTNYLRKF